MYKSLEQVMSITYESSAQSIVDEIFAIVSHKLTIEKSSLLKEYFSKLMNSLTIEDLKSKSAEDYANCLLSNWNFINTTKNSRNIKVYNPSVEQDGWKSNYTIIEINVVSKPFLIDSIRLAIQKLDIDIHLIANVNELVVSRDNEIIIHIHTTVTEATLIDKNHTIECCVYIEIDKQLDAHIQELVTIIKNVIDEVETIVLDWKDMRIKAELVLTYVNSLLTQFSLTGKQIDELDEIHAFMHWITSNHFIFLGYAEFSFENQTSTCKMKYIKNSALGVMRNSLQDFIDEVDMLPPQIANIYLKDEIMLLCKSSVVSKIHRSANIDLISIKVLNSKKEIIKELRFAGLYTSNAYSFNTLEVPYIRKKINNVFKTIKLSEQSHDGSILLNIIDNLPRDDIFHASEDELCDLLINIMHMKERQKIKLFIRKDLFGRYYSCFVYVPREKYDSSLREKIQTILLNELQGVDVTFRTNFNESVLARIHFIVKISPKNNAFDINVFAVEQKIIDAAKIWSDKLFTEVYRAYKDDVSSKIFKDFECAFGNFYQESFSPEIAAIDISYLQKLSLESDIEMNLYKEDASQAGFVNLKLFCINKSVILSDVVPIIENMGLKVVNERPYKIITSKYIYWINDYKLIPPVSIINVDGIKEVFLDAFAAVLNNLIDNDKFNKLVLTAKQNFHDVKILRAYYKYLWQAGLSNSQMFVEDALTANFEISKKLINLFHVKFNPELNDHIDSKNKQLTQLTQSIISDLEKVSSLNHDKIIRLYLEAMNATIRTNFFQKEKSGANKDYLSFKIESSRIHGLPLPKPLFEIFVYARELEGIHLRGSEIARGGIRWSDRIEDYRTEVLGLMKAQQVKNSVIVPLGAKGGFIVKSSLNDLDKSKQDEVVVNCYKTFIKGLLDITDNIINGKTISPENVVAWDKFDPYLVVAADKGTAKFSDIANAISMEYNFWLGDAFASGGSQGYDHKKLAITSRGVFESVKMHFNVLGVDVENQPITVIGIGDMAGDVFGNGLLLSKNYKLVAAFNHMHIFLDPNPDIKQSFKERARLFNLDYSTWEDYNPKLISQGGGVFKRADKRINISKELKELFSITEDFLEPDDLILIILKSKVDLLWNGGVGTFVKSSGESHAVVGDRVNDAIRINGNELRVKVVAEGGNLGFTQLGRVEYAKNGGLINTDALDNSAGVNCSDFEVNIKILLQAAIENKLLTIDKRNKLLAEMQDDVCELVLANNLAQNEAISYAAYRADKNLRMHAKLMHDLETHANLNSKIEFLPAPEELTMRQNQGMYFTRPELCVLMAYSKIQLKSKLLASKLPDEKFNETYLFNYFPKPLHKNYAKYMLSHSLRKSIIATKLSNKIINEMGLNFINRLYDETGAQEDNIVRCYLIINEIFNGDKIRQSIRQQTGVTIASKIDMTRVLNRLVRQATRWLLQQSRTNLSIEDTIAQFAPVAQLVNKNLFSIISNKQSLQHEETIKKYALVGVDKELAATFAQLEYMFAILDITDISVTNNIDAMTVAKTYFAIGTYLELNWFRSAIIGQPVSSNWDALARSAFRDDVDSQQRTITLFISNGLKNKNLLGEQAEIWFGAYEDGIKRWKFLANSLKAGATDFTMFAVALRELLSLSRLITCSF
jgi:glutamate dehydrogenase